MKNCNYCNKLVYDGNIIRHESSCFFNPKNIRYCKNCDKILKTRHQKKFCSFSCSATYNNKGRKLSSLAKKNIGKGVKAVSPTRPDALRDPITIELSCPICGKIQKIKTTGPASYGKTRTCSKKCYSKLLSIKSIESGCGGYREGAGRSKMGYYKGMFCGSSYELIFAAYHLDVGSNIKRCELKIPYKYKDKKHIYHPDFMIDDKIYEMKGFHTEVVDIKTQAAVDAGYEIDVLYLEELQPMLDYLKKKYIFKNVIELYE